MHTSPGMRVETGRLGDRGPEEWIVPIDLSPQNRIDVAARSIVFYVVQLHWPHHGLRVSTPLCPERTQHWLAHEESRARRGLSRQGQLSAASAANRFQDHHAADAAAGQRKV